MFEWLKEQFAEILEGLVGIANYMGELVYDFFLWMFNAFSAIPGLIWEMMMWLMPADVALSINNSLMVQAAQIVNYWFPLDFCLMLFTTYHLLMKPLVLNLRHLLKLLPFVG